MYQIIEFDGVPLPLLNPDQNHTGARAESTILNVVGGGAFDFRGNRRRRGRSAQFAVTGVLVGEIEYEVAHNGNHIVDHSGNRILVGTATNRLRGQIEALRAKRGIQAPLWRIRLDDNERQWLTARLLEVQNPQTTDDRLFKASVTCQFETTMDAWRGATQIVKSGSLINGTIGVNVSGGPVPIHDVVITVDPSGGSMTFLRISSPHQGIDLRFTGPVGASQILTIDCGAQTVRIDGVDAYSGFALTGNHSAEGWCPIGTGLPVFEVESDRIGTISFKFYYQFL